jgi:hypothetical protein
MKMLEQVHFGLSGLRWQARHPLVSVFGIFGFSEPGRKLRIGMLCGQTATPFLKVH